MKKAQILSALALAFALGLGVVAPVANTYAAARITGSADEATKTTATVSEVKQAIRYIESNATYSAYKNLASDVKDITDAKIGNTGATAYASVSAATIALKGAMDSLGISYNTGANLDTLIATAQGGNFAKWEKLIDAIAAANNVVDKTVTSGTVFDNLFQAIKAIDSKVTLKGEETLEDLIDFVTSDNKLDGLNDNDDATYANYGALDTAIDMAGKTQDLDKNIRRDLKAANIEIEDDVDTLAELSALAQGTASGDVAEDTANATKYNNWNAVVLAVKAANTNLQDNIDTLSATDLYQIIDKASTGLLQKMQAATGNTKLTVADMIKGATSSTGTNQTTTIYGNAMDGDKTLTTVTVTSDFGDDNLIVKVVKSDKEVAAFKGHKYAMFDITINKAGDPSYKFDGKATVTIKVPEGVNGEKAGVYYVDDEGKASLMEGAKFDKADNTFTFSTTHFSLYAIVEDAAAGLPNTGVISAAVEGNASTTVAMVAGIATALTAAGAGVVAYRNARRSVRK